jgi:hypothetical protein
MRSICGARRLASGIGILTLTVLSVAGCGSSSPSAVSSPTVPVGTGVGSIPGTVTSGTPTSTSAAAACATSGHVGDTLCTSTASEDPLKVTLVKVIDPATPADPNNAATAGTRWVGFNITVVVEGPDSNSGVAFAIGSDGKEYGYNSSYTLGNTAGCTETEVNESGGGQQGKPETICPGAMIPNGVSVAKVAFSGLGTDSGTGVVYWTVP